MENSKALSKFPVTRLRFGIIQIGLVLAVLAVTARYNYLLFHTAAEFMVSAIGLAIFMLAWNARKFARNNFYLFFGTAFVAAGAINMIHTLAYRGMGIFAGTAENSNLATQLWLANQYILAGTFVVAPFLIRRKISTATIILSYSVVFTFFLLAIFYWKIFPAAYVEGIGLTSFKKNSEHIVAALFLVSAFIFWLKKDQLDRRTANLIYVIAALFFISTAAFALYIGVFGFLNEIGHLTRIMALYVGYLAFVESGLMRPYHSIFQELKTSEDRYRAVLEDQEELICRFNPQNGVLTFVNNAYAKYYGKKPDELIGKSYWEHVPPEDLENDKSHINALTFKNPVGRIEHQAIDKDGNIRWQQWTSRAIFDKNGKNVECQAVGRDITERKRAEESLIRAKDEWERTFDSVPDLIAIIDTNHKIVRANKAMAERLGANMDQCVGLNCYKCVHNSKKPIDACPHSLTLADGKEHIAEVEEPNLGGTFLVSTTPFFDEKGKLMGSVHVARDITERKRAEEVIKKSESRLKKSQEMAHLGSWELDLVNGRLSWSDETYRIFGLKPQEFAATYEAFLKAVHPEDRTAVDKAYTDSVKAEKNGYELEHRVVRPDGDVRHVHEKCEHFRDKSGRIIRSVGMVHDITGRKEAERIMADLAKFPLENPNPVMRVSRDGRLLYANPASDEILRHLKFREEDFVPLDLRKKIQSATKTSAKNNFDLKIGEKHFMILVAPVANSGYANVYGQEITKRKKAEEALVYEKEKLKQILDNMEDGVYIASKDHNIIYANPALKKNFGADLGNSKCFEYLHNRKSLCPWCRNDAVFSGKSVHWECYFTKNKKTFDIIETPMVTPDGIPIKLEIFRDITEKKKIDQAKDDFMSLASHQLRTPLSSIGLSAELLLRGVSGKMEEGQKEYLEEIFQATKRMSLLVNNLLNVSRLEMGTLEVKKDLLDAKAAADAAIKEFEMLAAEKKIEVKKRYGTDLPIVSFGESTFRIVFDNFLSNALRYTPRGGRVSVELAAKGNNVILKVSDSGCGIPEGIGDKIFEKSFRAENAKEVSSEGAGLGLYMVKSIAERTGAKVWYESKAGKGTNFFFAIPADLKA